MKHGGFSPVAPVSMSRLDILETEAEKWKMSCPSYPLSMQKAPPRFRKCLGTSEMPQNEMVLEMRHIRESSDHEAQA